MCDIETAEIFGLWKGTRIQKPNAVTERVNDVASDLKDRLRSSNRIFRGYSIVADESTDDKDAAHITVPICVCTSDFLVTEDLLELIPLRGTAVEKYVFVRV